MPEIELFRNENVWSTTLVQYIRTVFKKTNTWRVRVNGTNSKSSMNTFPVCVSTTITIVGII